MLTTYADQQDDRGCAVVVRNGHHPEREIQTGIGPVTVRVPKVRSRQGGAGHLSFGVGSALCAQDGEPGSGHSVALSKLARRTTGVSTWVKALPAGGGGLPAT